MSDMPTSQTDKPVIPLDAEIMIQKLLDRLNGAQLVNIQLETIIEMKDRELAELNLLVAAQPAPA